MLSCKQHNNTQISGKGVAAIQLYSVCTSREPFAVEGSCTILRPRISRELVLFHPMNISKIHRNICNLCKSHLLWRKVSRLKGQGFQVTKFTIQIQWIILRAEITTEEIQPRIWGRKYFLHDKSCKLPYQRLLHLISLYWTEAHYF